MAQKRGGNNRVQERQIRRLTEGFGEMKELIETQAENNKKPSGLRKAYQTIIHSPLSFIAAPVLATFVGIQIVDNNIDSTFLDRFNFENSDGLICVNAGYGGTPYAEVANRASSSLGDIGHRQYRPCTSPGSETNIKRLDPELDNSIPFNARALSIAQHDVADSLSQTGVGDYMSVILDLDNNPECLFSLSTEKYNDFDSFIEESLRLSELNNAGQEITPIKVATVREGSGSFFTTNNILNNIMDTDTIEIVTYNSPEDVATAIKSGMADIGFFVEFTGRVQGKFQSGLGAVFNQDIALLEMPQEIFEQYDLGNQYKLQQITIHKEFSWNPSTWMDYIREGNEGVSWKDYSTWMDYSLEGDIELSPMACTHPVIVGRNPNNPNNPDSAFLALSKNYIQPLHNDIRTQFSSADFLLSDAIEVNNVLPTPAPSALAP